MNILAICPRVPADSRNGDQVLSYHRLSFLAQKHKVHVLCFARNYVDDSDRCALEALGITLHIVPWKLLNAIWYCLMAMFDSSIPFQCGFYTSHAFRLKFRKILKEFNPDVVYAVTVRPLYNISLPKENLFLDLVDSMGLNFTRRRDAASGLKRFLLSIESERVIRFERKVVQLATRSFVVSDLDRKFIGDEKICVLPLGIDMSHFHSSPVLDKESIVVFSGNMFYQPNVEAVLWFVNCCWEAVKKLVPEVRLVIAGSNPAPSIKALAADASITVTGRVESMAAVLNASQVAIAPMISGSGMQFKVLEAMACAVPVVATTIGLGDIKAVSGKDILIGDTPDAIVELVVSLLLDRSRRVEVGESGYRYVLKNHNWNAINERFALKCGF